MISHVRMPAFTPAAGEAVVPPWTPHAWWLLPSDGDADEDEQTIVWERTTPATREKEVFFRNLVGTLRDTPPGRAPSMLQLYATFAAMDNYPLLGAWAGLGARSAAFVVTKVVGAFARLVGFRAFYVEYTPGKVYEEYKGLL